MSEAGPRGLYRWRCGDVEAKRVRLVRASSSQRGLFRVGLGQRLDVGMVRFRLAREGIDGSHICGCEAMANWLCGVFGVPLLAGGRTQLAVSRQHFGVASENG